jgi:hypothetical protein
LFLGFSFNVQSERSECLGKKKKKRKEKKVKEVSTLVKVAKELLPARDEELIIYTSCEFTNFNYRVSLMIILINSLT